RFARTILITLAVVVVYVIAYQGSEVNFGRLFTSLPKGGPLLRAFLTPDLVTREIRPVTLDLDLPVPCGSAPPGQVPASGPRLVPAVPCAAPRDMFTVEGFDLPPNTELQLRWRLPGGQYYPGPYIATDGSGRFSAQFEARPIVATQNGVPSKI